MPRLRLALVALTLVLGSASATHAQANWSATSDIDEMTDDRVAVVRTRALSAVQAGYRSLRPTLLVRCTGGELDVYFNIGMPADEDVQLRLDEGEVFPVETSQSTDYEALFVSSFGDPNPIQLLDRLTKARQLRLRVVPVFEDPITVRFNVAGLRPHLARLQQAGCNTTPPPPGTTALGGRYEFEEPPAGSQWIGEPGSKAAYRLDCPVGTDLLRDNRKSGRRVPFFADRAAVEAAGYRPIDAGCPASIGA